jgi:hypothetical protein
MRYYAGYDKDPVLAAFTLSEMENLDTADFARPKGARDKRPRRRRGAAIAGAGLAGAGVLGAGIRYGGAELATRRKVGSALKDAGVKTGGKYLRAGLGGGAPGQARRDIAAGRKVLTNPGEALKNLGMSTNRGLRGMGSRAKAAATGTYRGAQRGIQATGAAIGNDMRRVGAAYKSSPIKRPKGVLDMDKYAKTFRGRAGQTRAAAGQLLRTRTGKVGLAAAGLAAAGGAGAALYNRTRKRRK